MSKANLVARLSEIQIELRREILDGDPRDPSKSDSVELFAKAIDVLLDDIGACVEQSKESQPEERQSEGKHQQPVKAVASDQVLGEAVSSRQDSSNSLHDLKDRIAEFESSHPRLTCFVAEVTELLASIGI